MLAVLLLMALALPQQTQTIDWASDTQAEAFRYGPFPQCASGGFGAGKTWDYCMKGLWLSDTFPRNRGVIARRVAKELRTTTMATFYKLCPPSAYARVGGGRRNDQEGYLKLAGSGSEILFLHFEDPETQAMLRGLEINWFLIDQAEEAPEIMEEVFDILLGRLSRWDVAQVPQWLLNQEQAAGREWAYINPRTGRPAPPPYAMIACNPDVELHWIYRRFHPESPERTEKKLPELDTTTGEPTGRMVSYADLGYRMFEMPSLENRFLSETNKQQLLAHDDAFLRRYVYGKWGIPEGAIHLIPPESLIPGDPDLLEYFRNACTLHRTLDHGDSSPTCCLWWAVDKSGNVFCFREYYLPNALISSHRQNITSLSEYERYEFNLADPSIFYKVQKLGSAPSTNNREHGGKWSVADEYADVTNLPRQNAIFWQPADNNELGTRNRINEYLRVDPDRIHPITKQKGSPRLFFVAANESYPQGCVHCVRETRAQRRVKIGTDMGRPVFSDERDPNIVDHAHDPVRYFIASRPPVFVHEAGPAPRNSFAGQQQMAEQYRRQMRRRR
jgi:hypothetical protein